MEGKVVEVNNLIMKYGDNVVLNNLSFFVERGDFIAILGKSGAGKSTLLRCLNKLNVANSGEIIVDNTNIGTAKGQKLQNIRKKIAFIFQDYNIIDNLYTIENVLTPFLAKKNIFNIFFNNYTKEEYELAYKYLEKVGLAEEAFRKSKYLSGGQKQRVAIAKALCQNPEIILADEPISSLDTNNSEAVMKLLQKLNNKKEITVLINLHDIEIAKKYSKKIIGLKDKEILFFKDTESVTEYEIKELYS